MRELYAAGDDESSFTYSEAYTAGAGCTDRGDELPESSDAGASSASPLRC